MYGHKFVFQTTTPEKDLREIGVLSIKKQFQNIAITLKKVYRK